MRSSEPARTPHRRPGTARGAAFITAALLAIVAPRVYAQMRVAVVDINRAMWETDQGRRVKTQLKNMLDKRQSDLDGRQQALKQMRDDIEKQQKTLPAAELEQRMRDYQKQFVDLQQSFLESQQDLAQREAELTKQIYTNLQTVIRQLGQQENFTAIFEQGGVVWAPQHLDLTDRVVQAYNRSPASREGAAPAAGGAARPGARPAPATRPAATPNRAPAPAPAPRR